MADRLRLLALGLLANALAVLLVAGAATADDSDPEDTPSAGPVPVDDAVLRWGVNNESNNKAFAPNTFNFFSAGLRPDPGRGGVVIKQAQWQASLGNTRIEKWNGSTWQPATWGGLSTDSSEAPLTAPTEAGSATTPSS